MPPLFTVIIPTHDRPDLLRQAVGSVLSQSIADFECLVVNDAGGNPPQDFGDERVRVIHREINGGQAAAINTGLKEARGESILFLDDDDLFTPIRLELAREGLKRAPIAVCWGEELNNPGAVRRTFLEGAVHDMILDGTTPNLGQVAVRREDALPLDERFSASADIDWWLRVTRGCRLATTPAVGYIWRSHPQIRGLNGPEARIRASLAIMATHSEYFGSHSRARAFRWQRIGLMSSRVGDRRLARIAFRRSLKDRPSLSVAWGLLHALGRSSRSVSIDPELRDRFGLGHDARDSYSDRSSST